LFHFEGIDSHVGREVIAPGFVGQGCLRVDAFLDC